MNPYLTYEEYKAMGGNTLPENEAEKYLKKASRMIDSLTFNRIPQVGFENLSEFQSEIIKETCMSLADFYCENEDVLNYIFKTYSLNGVSMTLDAGITIRKINGVLISEEIYSALQQTGLCSLSFAWRRGF